jgi:hypothetical protein
MVTQKPYSPFIKCDSWGDFIQLSKDPKIIVYNFRMTEGAFQIYAIKERVFTYKEKFPFPQKTEVTKNGSKWKFRTHTLDNDNQLMNTGDLAIFSRQPLQKKLECGIPYSVIPKLSRERGKWTITFKCETDLERVAGFLSETLKVSRNRVIEGDVYGL